MIKLSVSKLQDKIQIYPKNWIHIFSTNCYAYALGLDLKQEKLCKYAYAPGTISNQVNSLSNQITFDYEMLFDLIEKDFELMGIDYRQVEPLDKVENGEWKVAVYGLSYYVLGLPGLLCDYHFVRSNEDGTWSHKRGFGSIPTRIDNRKKIIIDPSKCDLGGYEYKRCYVLKINKKNGNF